MKKTNNNRLCNEDCCNCEVVENKQLALLLNVLALRFGKEVWHITNRICPNMTCCPICRIDDFCHDCERKDTPGDTGIAAIDEISKRYAPTCEVAQRAMKVMEEINTENEQCASRH